MSSDGIEISVSDPLPLPDAEEPEAALVAGGSPPGDADVPPPERPDDADGHIDIGASGTYRERKDSYRRSLNDGTVKSVDPCEFRGSIRSIVQEGDEKERGFLHKAFTCLTKGGTSFDSFLLAASQEVGQSILTLPWVFSLVGMTSGICLQLFFATAALYTNYLLVNLHTEYRKRLAVDKDDPRSSDVHYVVSYADIMGYLIGWPMKWLSFAAVFVSLFGLTTVQIIATGSNMYIFYPEIPKRTWGLISGAVFALLAFIPNFRHYRFLVVTANIATTYTSWYMTISAATDPDAPEDPVYDAPRNYDEWFRGMVGLLFVYGGHASNIEVADVMDDHSTYDRAYFWSYLYVFTLTMPNAATAYYSYGNIVRDNQNAFGLYEASPARDFGIIMMCINNLVAFGLFIGPLFHIMEKALKIHRKAFWIRVLARLPLIGIIVLFAIAFPFYGAFNTVLGAFTTSFATYIIPLIAFNLVFRKKDDTINMAKPLPAFVQSKFWLMRFFNYFLAFVLLVSGVGLGGYASIKNFVAQIDQFQYFAECYGC